MAVEYPSLKVPDLKKLLQERGLVVSGNKAELIARLQEDDKKSGLGSAGEDEIDWDEDDKTASNAQASTSANESVSEAAPLPASTTVSATTKVSTPASTPAVDSKTTKIQELRDNITQPKLDDSSHTTTNKTSTEERSKASEENKKPGTSEEISSKRGYSIGLGQSDSIIEAEKRAARAKRFGMPQSEEAVKMAERAKKFRLPSSKDEVIQSLDTALPENRPKRMRDEKDISNSRSEKRQGTDRVRGRIAHSHHTGLNKMKITSILDDPIEKAKADARAKRFSRPIVT